MSPSYSDESAAAAKKLADFLDAIDEPDAARRLNAVADAVEEFAAYMVECGFERVDVAGMLAGVVIRGALG